MSDETSPAAGKVVPSQAKRPYVVVAILDREDKLDAVLKALARRGHGATVFNSIGMGRHRAQSPDIPLIASISKFLQGSKDLNVTVLSVVDGENAVWEVIGAIEGEVGGLDNPHAGIAFAFPITHLTGYMKYQAGDLTP